MRIIPLDQWKIEILTFKNKHWYNLVAPDGVSYGGEGPYTSVQAVIAEASIHIDLIKKQEPEIKAVQHPTLNDLNELALYICKRLVEAGRYNGADIAIYMRNGVGWAKLYTVRRVGAENENIIFYFNSPDKCFEELRRYCMGIGEPLPAKFAHQAKPEEVPEEVDIVAELVAMQEQADKDRQDDHLDPFGNLDYDLGE